MEGGRRKEGRKNRENKLTVQKDFGGMLSDVFGILHAALVSHARRSFSTPSVFASELSINLRRAEYIKVTYIFVPVATPSIVSARNAGSSKVTEVTKVFIILIRFVFQTTSSRNCRGLTMRVLIPFFLSMV